MTGDCVLMLADPSGSCVKSMYRVAFESLLVVTAQKPSFGYGRTLKPLVALKPCVQHAGRPDSSVPAKPQRARRPNGL